VADRLHHIDLCSGIGGFALGFEWAGLSRPVMFCDIEPWSRKVLAKHWPDVPIADDVKVIADDPDRFIPRTDPRKTILTSGYPCQPFSQAGARRGTSDSRHIYPYISEIIAHKRPAFAVFENVYGHLSLGLDEVLNDLANQDYAARPFIFPSGAIVGAPHHRKRVWIIARNVGNAAHNGRDGRAAQVGREGAQDQPDESQSGVWCEPSRSGENVADTDNEGSQGRLSGRQDTQWQGEHGHARCSSTVHRQSGKDKSKPIASMGRMADGLSTRMDGFDGWEREPADIPRVATGIKQRAARLKGLGNAIVPAIAMNIGLTIKAMIDE